MTLKTIAKLCRMECSWRRGAFFLALFVCSSHCQSVEENEVDSEVFPVFQTHSGPVQGVLTTSSDGQEVNALFGIPYADPPIGDLRFRPPREVQPWKSVLHANKPLAYCYQQLPTEIKSEMMRQMRLMMLRPWSEDCLHLNVWTPKTIPQGAPIYFFIHGGGFIGGHGTMLTDGTNLAAEGQMMVITFNYRLGVFGFLALGTPDAPGNLGLMDQNLALRWVRDNAEVFGGDPSRITVAGTSSGSASVGLHLLSPKSSGLFSRAIMMSGSPTSAWSFMEPEKIVLKTKQLLDALGCQSPNTTEALNCLRQRHAEDILDNCRTRDLDLSDNFVPTVDGKFLTEPPSVSVEAHRFNVVDLLIGTTSDEGAGILLMMNPDVIKTPDGRIFARDFQKILGRATSGMSKLQSLVLDILYTNWSNPEDPFMFRDAAKDIFSDSGFDCDVNYFADKMAQTENTVYRYVYDYNQGGGPLAGPSWARVPHGLDHMPLMAPVQILERMAPLPEIRRGFRTFRKHIENFVKSGDPNLNREEYPEEHEWPKYDSRKLALYFSPPTSSIQPANRRPMHCAAWKNLLPLLEKDC